MESGLKTGKLACAPADTVSGCSGPASLGDPLMVCMAPTITNIHTLLLILGTRSDGLDAFSEDRCNSNTSRIRSSTNS